MDDKKDRNMNQKFMCEFIPSLLTLLLCILPANGQERAWNVHHCPEDEVSFMGRENRLEKLQDHSQTHYRAIFQTI